MPFLAIETSDIGMSVFAVLTGKNGSVEMGFTLGNRQKRTDTVVSGGNSENAQIKNNINK